MNHLQVRKLFKKSNFKYYSFFCLIFNLFVIFWGAWVRLSLSGDGCGESWPLCNQSFFPKDVQAWIEWIHRFSSGLALLFVFFLWLFSVFIYKKKQAPRFFSFWSLFFILIEALIGAILVLSGLVALNTKPIRIIVLAIHSVNSFLLTASLTLSYKSLLYDNSLKSNSSKTAFTLKEQLIFNKPLIYFMLAFPLLALTGNIASLAGQLFPTESLLSALALDLMPSAHLSLKIRPFHPLLACLFVLLLVVFQQKKRILGASFFVVLVGFATLLSLSPISMKLIHLFCAYGLGLFLTWNSIEIKKEKTKS